MIWTSLAEQAVYPQDREQCFRWFAEVKKNPLNSLTFREKLLFLRLLMMLGSIPKLHEIFFNIKL